MIKNEEREEFNTGSILKNPLCSVVCTGTHLHNGRRNLRKNHSSFSILLITQLKHVTVKIKATTDMLTNMVFTKNYDEYHEKYKT